MAAPPGNDRVIPTAARSGGCAPVDQTPNPTHGSWMERRHFADISAHGNLYAGLDN
jgi:hypothetical protein